MGLQASVIAQGPPQGFRDARSPYLAIIPPILPTETHDNSMGLRIDWSMPFSGYGSVSVAGNPNPIRLFAPVNEPQVPTACPRLV